MMKSLRTIAIITLNTVLLLAAIEVFFYWKHYGFVIPRPQSSFNFRYYRSFMFKLDPIERVDSTTGDTSLLIPSGFINRPIVRAHPVFRIQKARNPLVDLDISQKDKAGLWAGRIAYKPNYSGHSIVKTLDGRNGYDVVYNTDEFARRKTDNPHPSKRTKHFIMLGCSFTFGEGVHQDETISSQIAKRAPRYNVYNYGVQGMGPQDILRQLEDMDASNEIKESAGAGMYLFIMDHVRRSIPSISYLGHRKREPFFWEGDNGEIHRAAAFGEVHPVRDFMYSLLEQSEILSHFRMDFPRSFGEEAFRKTAKLISHMEKVYKSKFPRDDFYVVLYPEPSVKDVMTPYLTQYGLRVLDYTPYDIQKYVPGIVESLDRHPSAEENAVLADQIVKDLKL